MRFVIVGYGRVGARTARVLLEEGHDVVVVETDDAKAQRAREAGVEVVHGDGSDESVLTAAGVESADAVGGLTGDPNVNYAACIVGRRHGCRTVMRISEDFREEKYRRYADDVDEIVYPERLGAAGAKTALLGGNFNAIGDLTEQLEVTVMTVPEEAPVVGRHVSSLDRDDARVYAHGRRREEMTIPLPGTTIEPGDRLALILRVEALPEVRRAWLGADADGSEASAA
jgi:trk system potassium uptake protein TrkA